MKFFYFEFFKGKNQFFQSCSGFKFPNLWGGGGSDRGLEISKQFFFSLLCILPKGLDISCLFTKLVIDLIKLNVHCSENCQLHYTKRLDWRSSMIHPDILIYHHIGVASSSPSVARRLWVIVMIITAILLGLQES